MGSEIKIAHAKVRQLRKVIKLQQREQERLIQLNATTHHALQRKIAELDDKTDKLIPQKQLLLKELAFLVNATSRAVRTTMWSMAPEKRRGF